MSSEYVILTTAGSPFAAHNLAAVLADHDIETRVLDGADADVPLEQAYRGVPVLVRSGDVERARAMLAESEIDWDEVDVGDREDDLPLRKPGRMPIAARVSFIVAVLAVLMAAALAALAIFGA